MHGFVAFKNIQRLVNAVTITMDGLAGHSRDLGDIRTRFLCHPFVFSFLPYAYKLDDETKSRLKDLEKSSDAEISALCETHLFAYGKCLGENLFRDGLAKGSSLDTGRYEIAYICLDGFRFGRHGAGEFKSDFSILRLEEYVPPHCIIVDKAERFVVVATRGSDNLSDWSINSNSFVSEKSGMFHGDPVKWNAHLGMASSGGKILRLIKPTLTFICEQDDYGLSFVGHSLGGGISAILGFDLMFNSRIDLTFERPISVIMFGAPPVIELKSGFDEDARTFIRERFTMMFVENDPVPRLHLFNIFENAVGAVCLHYNEAKKENPDALKSLGDAAGRAYTTIASSGPIVAGLAAAAAAAVGLLAGAATLTVFLLSKTQFRPVGTVYLLVHESQELGADVSPGPSLRGDQGVPRVYEVPVCAYDKIFQLDSAKGLLDVGDHFQDAYSTFRIR